MAVTVGSVIIHLGVDATGMTRFSSAANQAARDSARIRQAAVTAGNDVTKSFTKAGQTVAVFAGHMGGLGASFRAAGQVLGSLTSNVAALGVAFGAATIGASKFIQSSDRMKRMENNLRTVTTSAQNLADIQQSLFEISQRARMPLEGAVTLYARMARATDSLGISQQKLLRITETVQKAFAVGGATTQEAMGAAIQLSQGIASDRFSGEEFRSVAENAPVLLREMAAQLGVNIGKLREMAHAGELTGKVVTDAIYGASEAIDKDFGKTISTVDQSFARLRNSMDQYVYDVDKTYGVTSGLAGMLNGLADNFEQVADYATMAGLAIATLFAGRLGGAALRSGASSIAGGFFAGTRAQAQKQLDEIRSTLVEVHKQRQEIEKQIKEADDTRDRRLTDMRLAQSNALSAARNREIEANQKANVLVGEREGLTKRLAAAQSKVLDGLRAEQEAAKAAITLAERRVRVSSLEVQRGQAFGREGNVKALEREQRALNRAKEDYVRISERIRDAERGSFNTSDIKKYSAEIKSINSALAANHKAQIAAGQELVRAQNAYLVAQRAGPEVAARARAEMERTAQTVGMLQAEQARLNEIHRVTVSQIAATERRLTMVGAAAVRVGGFFRGMWGMLGGGPGVALMAIIGTLSALQIAAANSAREMEDFKQKLRDLGYLAPDVSKDLLDVNKAAESGKWVELREELAKTEEMLQRMKEGDWFSWIPFSGGAKGFNKDVIKEASDTLAALKNTSEMLTGTKLDENLAQQGAVSRFIEIVNAVTEGKALVKDFESELQKLAQVYPHLEMLVRTFKEMGSEIEAATARAKDLAEGVDKAAKTGGPSWADREAESMKKLEKMRRENKEFFDERSRVSGLTSEKKALEDRTNAIMEAAEKEERVITESEARKQAIREIAAEKSVKIEEGMSDLRLDALASGLNEQQQEIVKSARSLGVATEDIEAFIAAMSSGDMSAVPEIFREIGQALTTVKENKFLQDLADLRYEAAASSLSKIDQELVQMAQSAGFTNAEIERLIGLLQTGNLDALPSALRDAREEMQKMAAANVMRDLQDEYATIGMSDVDKDIYETLRDVGLDLNDIDGQRIADQIRLNSLVQEQVDLAEELGKALKDGLSTFLQDLFTGKDLMESIVGIGSRFASMNFDNFVDSIFGKEDNIFGIGKAKAAGKAIGTQVVETVKSGVDKWAGLREVNVGANMAGSVGAYTSARAAGTAIGQNVSPVLAKTLSPIASVITKAANTLGISARDLATVISYETGGTFSTSIRGGAGNRHIGLIQFGPEEQRKYGAAIGQTLEQQMVAVVKYLQDRGLKPGMGLAQLYSTINAGNPYRLNASDAANGGAWGTVLDKVNYQMEGHKKNADKLLGQIPGAVQTAAEKGTKIGAAQGVPAGFEAVGANMTGGGGNGMTIAGGMLGSALGGFSTGYQSANPGMGLLGGAMQGWGAGSSLATTLGMTGMALPVIGMVVGAVGGLIGGILGARNKVKQARRELEKQMDAINNLLDIGFGKGMGNFQKRLSDFLAEINKAVPLAWKAERFDLVEQLQQSWNSMFRRLRTDFYDSFEETAASYASGLGLEAPVMKGVKALSDLREELRSFIADVKYFGEETLRLTDHEDPANQENIRQLQVILEQSVATATESAKRMIMSFIGGAKEFSEYESAVLAVKGAISVAQTALEELGMSAYAAAEALQTQLLSALAKLRSAFTDDISRSIYDLADMGFFNDLLDAQARYNDRLKDTAALGLSADLANMELSMSLRAIAREAKLTDAQITQLAAAFPELSGQLMLLMGINAEGADLAQALSDAEAKLEEAKANLRAAYQEEKSELESLVSRLKNFTSSLRKFKDSLKLDDDLSPLNPLEKLMEAKRQFDDISAKAMQGDEDAMSQLEDISREYLEEAKSYYGSTEAYYAIWKQVNNVLDNVLAKSDDQLGTAEQQLAALEEQVSKLIDIDDGVKAVNDAIKDLEEAQAAYDAAKKADDDYKNTIFAQMLEVLKAQLAAQQAAAAAQEAAQNAPTANYSASDPIANLYRSILGREPDPVGYAFYSGNLNAGLTTLAGIEADLRMHAANAGIGMAEGGLVTGGIPGVDSVRAMLMPGEFVMPAKQTQQHYSELLAMRSNSWSPANDNSSVSQQLDAIVFALNNLISIESQSLGQSITAARDMVNAIADQTRETNFSKNMNRMSSGHR